MKSKYLISIGLIFVFLSCNIDEETPKIEINGEYIGIFERGGNNSKVVLKLNNGNWSGDSEIVKFPALCNGTYSYSGNI